MFTTLLNWGRYGDVFGYSRDTDLFFLHRAETFHHSVATASLRHFVAYRVRL